MIGNIHRSSGSYFNSYRNGDVLGIIWKSIAFPLTFVVGVAWIVTLVGRVTTDVPKPDTADKTSTHAKSILSTDDAEDLVKLPLLPQMPENFNFSSQFDLSKTNQPKIIEVKNLENFELGALEIATFKGEPFTIQQGDQLIELEIKNNTGTTVGTLYLPVRVLRELD